MPVLSAPFLFSRVVRLRLLALALSGLSAGAAVADELPAAFDFRDWQMVCDNTRTCRSVGYQADDGDSLPVSLRLTRPAGPATPVRATLAVYSEDEDAGPYSLQVGSLRIDGLSGDPMEIPAAQVAALLRALPEAEVATVRGSRHRWDLSLAGAKAVLLKMDEVQGRIGTPGALVKRGSRDEAAVLPPLPAPIVRAAVPLPTRPDDAALARLLVAALPGDRIADLAEECDGEPPQVTDFQVSRLDEHRVLLSLPCAQGAYNFTYLLWMAADQPPYQPRQLAAEGDFDPNTGHIHSAVKGRGTGDCWTTADWQFDGRDFVLTGRAGDSMCRGFPGGAWSLPAYVTRRR